MCVRVCKYINVNIRLYAVCAVGLIVLICEFVKACDLCVCARACVRVCMQWCVRFCVWNVFTFTYFITSDVCREQESD